MTVDAMPAVTRSTTRQTEDEDSERVPGESDITRAGTELLNALHPDGGIFSVCAFEPRKQYDHFDNVDAAIRYAAQLDSKGVLGTYFGLADLRQRPRNGRGKEADVERIHTLWADADGKRDGVYSQDAKRETLQRLELTVKLGLMPKPSALVDSGGGWQPYWFLNAPAEGDDLPQVKALNARIAKLLGGDPVQDLSHVLRVPGTMNRKPDHGTPAPMCQLIELNQDRRYALDEIEAMLPAISTTSRIDEADQQNTSSPTHNLDDDALLNIARKAKNGNYFSRLFDDGNWRGSDYRSQSEADLALCGMIAFYTGPDASRINTLFQQSALIRDKWLRDDYRDATIAKALAGRTEFYQPGRAHTSTSSTTANKPDGSTATHIVATGREHLSDLGNCRRLVSHHAHDLRYCGPLGGWLQWDGQRWAVDVDGAAVRAAKSTIRQMYLEASALPDEDARKQHMKWALSSESATRIRAMVELATTEPEIIARSEAFDADPWALNCPNGTIDLRTGELRLHHRDALLTKVTGAEYDPNARDPILDRFLNDATNGQDDFRQYLQRAIGYTLAGVTDEEDVFLLLGPGGSGKTTLIEAMLAALGDYGVKATFSTFLARRSGVGDGDTPRPDLLAMRGARLVAAVEPEKGRRLDASVLKEISGGDSVTARGLYQSRGVTFRPTHTIWLAANSAPKMDDSDSGLWRRLKSLPFEHAIPEDKQDPKIKAHLLSPDGQCAVLAWAVEGCLAWQHERLRPPEIVQRRTSQLRLEFDPLHEFFVERCTFDTEATTPATELRDAYITWAMATGAKPLNDREWGHRLRNQGCTTKRTRITPGHGPISVWNGVRLLSVGAWDDDTG